VDPLRRTCFRTLPRIVAAWLLCAPVVPARADEALFSEPWRWATFTTESGLPSNEVLDLVETPKGTTWATTREGIAWFDGYQWDEVSEAQGLPSGSPNSIAPFGEDQVLVVLQSRLYVGGTSGFTQADLRYNGEALLIDVAAALDASRILVQARLVHEVG
jgi:hypothetical protein